jgi:hypothetical protein
LVAAAVACGISFLVLNDYYARSRPHQPNFVSGQIYPQIAGISRKAKVYLTAKELAAFYVLLGASIVPVLVAGALNVTWRVLRC